jgi:chromosome segregation ATPase
MSDERRVPPTKRTVEIYQDLVQVEVRALVNRVTELTQTIGEVFSEVTALALQLEESSGKVEQISTSLEYCKDELKKLRERVDDHARRLKEAENGGD